MKKPLLNDKFKGRHVADMIGSHPIHDAMVDDLKFMHGSLPPQNDGGNNEALMPSDLTNEATEEGLSSAVLTANKPHPGATPPTVFEITPNLVEFFHSPDGNTFEALGGDEPISQRANNFFAALLIVIHPLAPALVERLRVGICPGASPAGVMP
jgi:hypothetical protein